MRPFLLALLVPTASIAQDAIPHPPPAVSPAATGDVSEEDLARAAVARGDVRPLAELLPLVAMAVPGEVLDIELDVEEVGPTFVYEFEVLTPDGRLIEVEMDAATGALLEVEPEGSDDLDESDDDDD